MTTPIAFITGAGKGLGSELARQLLQKHNYRVIGTARDVSQLDTLRKEYPERFFGVHMDVKDVASIKNAAKEVAKFTDRIDLLVNNSGVLPWEANIESVTQENLIEAFLVNSAGPILTVQAFLPFVRNGSKKTIVNVTSRVGSVEDNSSGKNYSYRGSKAALNIMNKNLSIELSGEGITSVLVHPGMVYTTMLSKIHPTMDSGAVSTEVGAERLLENVILTLTKEDNGKFLSWNRSVLPWLG